ncbi:TPA: hypothetical protein ACGE8U_001654 [Klebsiella pneumoniae]|uniref:hypothetical protein n=1 Tax=Klebsiella pneumoniae TaxID=573 RepID=UPI0036FB5502
MIKKNGGLDYIYTAEFYCIANVRQAISLVLTDLDLISFLPTAMPFSSTYLNKSVDKAYVTGSTVTVTSKKRNIGASSENHGY